ncbi:MAG: hypothetical protein AAGF59_05335 [Pseudomonadota bacterium]
MPDIALKAIERRRGLRSETLEEIRQSRTFTSEKQDMQIFHLALKDEANKLSMARLGLRGVASEYNSKIPNLTFDLMFDDLFDDDFDVEEAAEMV